MTLDQADRHSTLRVLLISEDRAARRALNQLGLHAGDRVQVVRKAPFGGPLLVKTHGSQVAISRRLAESVRVEIVP